MLGQRKRLGALAIAFLVSAVSGCAGWGGGAGGGGADSINVLMVNNPQMVDLQKLTAEHFTKETGINVNFTVLPENDVRDKISQEFSSQAGQYDVASLSNFEIPIYATSKWIAPLSDYIANDPSFDQDDVLKSMTQSLSGEDGKVYGEPFYGESSFLMYRKDVLAAKGVTMPAKPTWQEVADIAAKVDNAQPGMRGICLRGQPGWGQLFAPLTTVVNTFGGTWFTEDWQAQVNAPEFTEATKFYVDLVRAHGELGAPQAGFTECLNNTVQSNVAMWYDATSAAGSLEAPNSPVKGKIGLCPGAGGQDRQLRLAVRLVLEHPGGQREEGQRLEVHLLGVRQGLREAGRRGARLVPRPGRQACLDVREPGVPGGGGGVRGADQAGDRDRRPAQPGVQPRPAIGIQFVDIPEFPDLGTQVSQDVSSAIAGRVSVDKALERGQELADDVAERYRSREAK